MRLVSWNVLRHVGATAEDLSELVADQHPDLLLLQEATDMIDRLPSLIGGSYWRQAMPNRTHGLAFWSPEPFPEPKALALPFDPKSRSGDRRIAAVLRVRGLSLVNVHLAHNQFLLRRQLQHIATHVDGVAVLVGDTNAIGPTSLRGYLDVGPRRWTHKAKGLLPVRLDRALVSGVECSHAAVLHQGRSDHRPILLDLVF